MRKVGFGIIGCGLMGREFASAAARWRHLPDAQAQPEIVAICDRFDTTGAGLADWYRAVLPSISQVTSDYRQLLANPAVEAVYCAVPHNLHRQLLRHDRGRKAPDGGEAFRNRPSGEPGDCAHGAQPSGGLRQVLL